MNERTKSIHSLVFLLQKNNCCEALLPVFLPGWRFCYVKKQRRKGNVWILNNSKRNLQRAFEERWYLAKKIKLYDADLFAYIEFTFFELSTTALRDEARAVPL